MIITSLPAATTQRFDELLAAATLDPYNNLPRLAFLVTSSSNVLYEGFSGIEHLPPPPEVLDGGKVKNQATIGPDSIFNLWSCTKLITIVSALQLIEAGKIGLQDDASKYVKEIGSAKRLVGFADDGSPKYERNDKVVTVEMLICHLAGFHIVDDTKDVKVSVTGPEATRETLTSISLRDEPGEKFMYGSSNEWLGLLIEDVSGLSLEDYFQRNVFKPLGISDISFRPNSKMMTPGILPPESSSFIFTTIPGFSPHQSYGGFGLNGSAGSYLKVLRAILNGGTLDGATILKPETVRSMFQPHFPSQSHKGDLVAFLKGELPQVDHTRIVGEDLNWGYGGMLNEKELPSGRGKYSLTWSGLMNTFWVIDPTNDIGFLLWTNTLPWSSRQLTETWEKLEPELYKALKAGVETK